MSSSYQRKRVVRAFHCLRCGYSWIPRNVQHTGRKGLPKRCPNPKCLSPYWSKERGQKLGRPKLTAAERRARLLAS